MSLVIRTYREIETLVNFVGHLHAIRKKRLPLFQRSRFTVQPLPSPFKTPKLLLSFLKSFFGIHEKTSSLAARNKQIESGNVLIRYPFYEVHIAWC